MVAELCVCLLFIEQEISKYRESYFKTHRELELLKTQMQQQGHTLSLISLPEPLCLSRSQSTMTEAEHKRELGEVESKHRSALEELSSNHKKLLEMAEDSALTDRSAICCACVRVSLRACVVCASVSDRIFQVASSGARCFRRTNTRAAAAGGDRIRTERATRGRGRSARSAVGTREGNDERTTQSGNGGCPEGSRRAESERLSVSLFVSLFVCVHLCW